MDACFLSVCFQLVKKPPGRVTQHAGSPICLCNQRRATIETDSEKNIEHSKNMHSIARGTQ